MIDTVANIIGYFVLVVSSVMIGVLILVILIKVFLNLTKTFKYNWGSWRRW